MRSRTIQQASAQSLANGLQRTFGIHLRWPRMRRRFVFAIAAAAVGLVGQEGAIMRTTLAYSVGLLAYVCLWTFVIATFG